MRMQRHGPRIVNPCQKRISQTACPVIAKFHYTNTDADPNGPARTQRSFAAKKARVRVRVWPV